MYYSEGSTYAYNGLLGSRSYEHVDGAVHLIIGCDIIDFTTSHNDFSLCITTA